MSSFPPASEPWRASHTRPTVRSCIAAVLILAGIALGRDAISLRLVATGALVVLVFRPEALAGASFQMSFAAVTAIVALHSTRWSARLFQRREEALPARMLRAGFATVATGLAVEAALIPLALYHFHRSGLYGVAANIVAIPLTTFVIMPLEAGALLLDAIGWGKPLWLLCGLALDLLLRIAQAVASAEGAVAMLPSMPGWSFGLMVAGGIWLCLWTKRWRLLGVAPFLVGATGAALSPSPDVLVTGDGRHLAVVGADGTPLILRDRAAITSATFSPKLRDSTGIRPSSDRRLLATPRTTPASLSSTRRACSGAFWRPALPTESIGISSPVHARKQTSLYPTGGYRGGASRDGLGWTRRRFHEAGIWRSTSRMSRAWILSPTESAIIPGPRSRANVRSRPRVRFRTDR